MKLNVIVGSSELLGTHLDGIAPDVASSLRDDLRPDAVLPDLTWSGILPTHPESFFEIERSPEELATLLLEYLRDLHTNEHVLFFHRVCQVCDWGNGTVGIDDPLQALLQAGGGDVELSFVRPPTEAEILLRKLKSESPGSPTLLGRHPVKEVNLGLDDAALRQWVTRNYSYAVLERASRTVMEGSVLGSPYRHRFVAEAMIQNELWVPLETCANDFLASIAPGQELYHLLRGFVLPPPATYGDDCDEMDD